MRPIALSYQESEERRLKQLAETRKQRLLQVREQAKELSQRQLRDYQQRAAELTDKKTEEARGVWADGKEEELQGMRQARDAALQRVGTGHRKAAGQLEANLEKSRRLKQEAEARLRLARERHEGALATEASAREADDAPWQQMVQRKEHVKATELGRSLAAVAECNQRMRERAEERVREAQEEQERLSSGLPSNIDFKFSRIHELGMPKLVERHSGAGADGHGKPLQESVQEQQQRAWEAEQRHLADRAAAADREEKRLAMARFRMEMETNKRVVEEELERIRQEEIRAAADAAARGASTTRVQRDIRDRKRKEAAERYVEERLLTGLRQPRPEQQQQRLPDHEPREATGWPTDEGWVPSCSVSERGAERGGEEQQQEHHHHHQDEEEEKEDEAHAVDVALYVPEGGEEMPQQNELLALALPDPAEEEEEERQQSGEQGQEGEVHRAAAAAAPVKKARKQQAAPAASKGPTAAKAGALPPPSVKAATRPRAPTKGTAKKGQPGAPPPVRASSATPRAAAVKGSSAGAATAASKPRRQPRTEAPASAATAPPPPAARRTRTISSAPSTAAPKRQQSRAIELSAPSSGASKGRTVSGRRRKFAEEEEEEEEEGSVGAMGSWTTDGDVGDAASASVPLLTPALAELRAIQEELGLPLSEVLPLQHGRGPESFVSGSSEISGLSAVLAAQRAGAEAAADLALAAAEAARTGVALYLHEEDDDREHSGQEQERMGHDEEEDGEGPEEPRPVLRVTAVLPSSSGVIAPRPLEQHQHQQQEEEEEEDPEAADDAGRGSPDALYAPLEEAVEDEEDEVRASAGAGAYAGEEEEAAEEPLPLPPAAVIVAAGPSEPEPDPLGPSGGSRATEPPLRPSEEPLVMPAAARQGQQQRVPTHERQPRQGSSPAKDLMEKSSMEAKQLRKQLLRELSQAASSDGFSQAAHLGGSSSAPISPRASLASSSLSGMGSGGVVPPAAVPEAPPTSDFIYLKMKNKPLKMFASEQVFAGLSSLVRRTEERAELLRRSAEVRRSHPGASSRGGAAAEGEEGGEEEEGGSLASSGDLSGLSSLLPESLPASHYAAPSSLSRYGHGASGADDSGYDFSELPSHSSSLLSVPPYSSAASEADTSFASSSAQPRARGKGQAAAAAPHAAPEAAAAAAENQGEPEGGEEEVGAAAAASPASSGMTGLSSLLAHQPQQKPDATHQSPKLSARASSPPPPLIPADLGVAAASPASSGFTGISALLRDFGVPVTPGPADSDPGGGDEAAAAAEDKSSGSSSSTTQGALGSGDISALRSYLSDEGVRTGLYPAAAHGTSRQHHDQQQLVVDPAPAGDPAPPGSEDAAAAAVEEELQGGGAHQVPSAEALARRAAEEAARQMAEVWGRAPLQQHELTSSSSMERVKQEAAEGSLMSPQLPEDSVLTGSPGLLTSVASPPTAAASPSGPPAINEESIDEGFPEEDEEEDDDDADEALSTAPSAAPSAAYSMASSALRRAAADSVRADMSAAAIAAASIASVAAALEEMTPRGSNAGSDSTSPVAGSHLSFYGRNPILDTSGASGGSVAYGASLSFAGGIPDAEDSEAAARMRRRNASVVQEPDYARPRPGAPVPRISVSEEVAARYNLKIAQLEARAAAGSGSRSISRRPAAVNPQELRRASSAAAGSPRSAPSSAARSPAATRTRAVPPQQQQHRTRTAGAVAARPGARSPTAPSMRSSASSTTSKSLLGRRGSTPGTTPGSAAANYSSGSRASPSSAAAPSSSRPKPRGPTYSGLWK